MSRRWIGVSVSLIRYVSSDTQPGIVEAELRDVNGRCWRFIDKCSVFGNLDVDDNTVYPQPGVILCRIVARHVDLSSNESVDIELYGICSVDYEDQFRVSPGALVEGEYNSVSSRPWDGQAEPNATFE